MKFSLRTFIQTVLFVALLALSLASLLPLLSGLWWVFDLASHFRVQLLVLSLLGLLGALLIRRAPHLVLAALVVVVNLVPVLPYLVPLGVAAPPAAPPANASRFCVLSFNVMMDTYYKDKPFAYLNGVQDDVVFLAEVNDVWLDGIAKLRSNYPYRVEVPRGDYYGVALYSRFPIVASEIITEPASLPTISATVRIDGREVNIVGTHPLAPITKWGTRTRDAQLRLLSHRLAGASMPTLLLGDFNTSPWSAVFADVTTAAGLRDSALGRGVQFTWPTNVLWLRTSIDHILVSREFAVTQTAVGPAVGSDHYPIRACLAF